MNDLRKELLERSEGLFKPFSVESDVLIETIWDLKVERLEELSSLINISTLSGKNKVISFLKANSLSEEVSSLEFISQIDEIFSI